MGPSGAGKSTLLNILAGYRTKNAGGGVLVNGIPRDCRQFRKMSRYIMQEDIHQTHVTVREAMMLAAHLKLGYSFSPTQKQEIINEILDVLRLDRSLDTITSRLSGGEKKRLSIALELINNPPVLFLDEPTTGLDDVSCSQCVSLLKRLSTEDRTVVCSVHTPSAKTLAQFDVAYILAEGQCVYQGATADLVPYLASLGINCPTHYNPADFMIEVSSGEYGDHIERMVQAIDNGRCQRWNQMKHPFILFEGELEFGEIKQMPDYGTSQWNQFLLLFSRMMIQAWRDISHIGTKISTITLISLLIGGLFYQMGNDGSKTIFIFGYCYISVIAFVYVSMLPALIWFPQEVELLKREYFNRWYHFNSYYSALVLSRLPIQIILTFVYIIITYTMTNQPMEWNRVAMFMVVSLLTVLVSECFGLIISSQLNITNAMFLGPTLSVPLMLLAVYSLGTRSEDIPIHMRVAMYTSYFRFGLEGLVASVYGGDRPWLDCPDTEMICELRSPKALLRRVGMENINIWLDILALCGNYLLFQLFCYASLKFRLYRNKNLGAIGVLGRYIKSHFNSMNAR
ncbi:hypothetical protein AAG570_004039 [Ranatra chinensis]|uniref:ABC transporter domain-containing protein n=1 Tax=Ranatra chinensis TaxID=642074 RepID=A0ABD0YKR2_9HEMI